MVRRQITSERNNIFSLLVSPSRINLLRGSGFACNRKTGNSSGGSGTAIAYHTAQGVTDFSCGFRRNHLPQLDRKITRLNSSHVEISYAVFCLKKKKAKDSDRRKLTFHHIAVASVLRPHVLL